jgi:trehalose synthase-fused probable maltokinase
MSHNRRPDRGVEQLARTFSPEWLAGQRWFRGKTRRLADVDLHDAAPLDRDGWLLVLSAIDEAGVEDRYLVPAVVDGDGFREPGDGEGVWQRLATLISVGGELRADRGRFVFGPVPASIGLPTNGASQVALGERRLTVEQSNTSVALGEQLMLKCYRLLEPGANPEVEIGAFLTAVGFDGAPRVVGSADYVPDEGQPAAAAILQEFVASEADAWNWVLGRLAGGPQGRAQATAGIAVIGTLTKGLHAALASRPDLPGFPVRAATDEEMASWRSGAGRQLDEALAAVSGEPRSRLLAAAPQVRDHLAEIGAAKHARVTRIHGDYHLGQLLKAPSGFKVIDFEGEPARPLAQRREPASPLRDVAGMLRSIDYVARVAHGRGAADEPDAWADEACEAFLAAYGGIPAEDRALLLAFEIEKACYEVRYEANNRPDWVWIPLAAVERLARRSR